MNKRWLKIGGTILSTVLLGAIGSGLWAKLLSPAWGWLVETIVRGMSAISDSFKDRIYSEAAKGFHEGYSLSVLSIFFGLVVGFYVAALMVRYLYKFDKPRDKVRTFMRSKKEFILFNFIALISIAMVIFMQVQSVYSNKVTTQCLNAIDILAPFTTPREGLTLRSEFLRIKNVDDYVAFYNKLKSLAETHHIELPLSKPL